MNSKLYFHSPIYAVLYDGQKFDFIFNGYANLLKLSRGVFPRLDGTKSPTIRPPHYEKAERLTFIKAIRPICEYFYITLLCGYIAGLQHYSTHSQAIAVGDKRLKESAPTWARVVAPGKEALKKGLEAAEMEKEVGTKEKANELATEGLEALKCRYVARWSDDLWA